LIVAIILLAFLYSRYKLARNQKKSVELEKNRNLVLSQRLYEQDQQLILSETAKTVAHQLNSPLGAIKAGMEGLEEQLVNVKLSIIESNPDSTELAFELSKYIDTSSEWNLSQRKKVQQQLYEKIKGHSNLKDEDVLKMAKDFSKLSIAEVPENLLTSILSLKESNNALSLAKGISNLNKISKVTQEATVKSSEAVDKIRETLNFKRDISKTEFKLFRTINTVISLLQAKAIDDTQIINKVDKTIILNDNEFRLIQLLYNLLFYIVGEIQKDVQIEVNSSNQEEHIVLQILLNKRIPSKLFNEHQYSIIFNSKHDSNELRMGIVQFLVVEKNYQILPIALDETNCIELKLPII
jgi:signal transduction histidine kinase